MISAPQAHDSTGNGQNPASASHAATRSRDPLPDRAELHGQCVGGGAVPLRQSSRPGKCFEVRGATRHCRRMVSGVNFTPDFAKTSSPASSLTFGGCQSLRSMASPECEDTSAVGGVCQMPLARTNRRHSRRRYKSLCPSRELSQLQVACRPSAVSLGERALEGNVHVSHTTHPENLSAPGRKRRLESNGNIKYLS